jgi:hypothetical protein
LGQNASGVVAKISATRSSRACRYSPVTGSGSVTKSICAPFALRMRMFCVVVFGSTTQTMRSP